MREATLLRSARRRAGLTQRALAERAGVPQSTVGRIESGVIDPRASTLRALLRACGYDLEAERRLGVGVDRTQIRERLRMSPRDRIERDAQAARALAPLAGIVRRRAPGPPITFDPMSLLDRLDDHDVRCVMIGALAAVAHGAPLVTQGVDLCPERSEANMARLAAALVSVNARERGNDPDDTRFRPDTTTLRAGDLRGYATDVGDVNVVAVPAGTYGYDDLQADADLMDLDGSTVRVASLSDLIRMKRAAGGLKDQIALEHLGALRDEIEGRGSV